MEDKTQVAGKPFTKGTSGNPNGRPKGPTSNEIKELARAIAPNAFARLCKWANSDDGPTSVRACNAILDRAYGKPTQQVDHGNADDKPLRFTINLSNS